MNGKIGNTHKMKSNPKHECAFGKESATNKNMTMVLRKGYNWS